MEGLIFGILRRLLRRPTLIVFETVILSHLENALYRNYYGLILSLIDIGICHSKVEVTRYAEAFPKARCRFVFVPFGVTVNGREALIAAATDPNAAIVTAGRSGRDYRTLVDAIKGLPCKLHIICDTSAPLVDIEPTEQVVVLRDSFGHAYIQALANALFVVVPLSVNDVSAGQMVLLQASALGKAVIITKTATTSDYAADGEDALFVDMKNVGQMRAAIRRLLDESKFRTRLGANALLRFERDHSTEAYVRRLTAEIQATNLTRKRDER